MKNEFIKDRRKAAKAKHEKYKYRVEKSIWFYAWNKSIDWKISSLTESESYRRVSLNIQKEYVQNESK